ncbi:MAG: helix-turn-helix domain-containing protein [Nitrospinales bacterium]
MSLIEVIKRIKSALKLRYDYEVAKKLNLSETALSERKRRNSIPTDKLIILCEREGINLDWLLTGKENNVFASRTTGSSTALYETTDDPKLKKMIEQFQRIYKEGDYRKLASLQLLLDLFDPPAFGINTD